MSTYKRLNYDNRLDIEAELKENKSLCSIAKSLNVSTSTISREIKAHSIELDTYAYGSSNRCIHRKDCTKNHICSKHYANCEKKRCASCRYTKCNSVCDNYIEDSCDKLSKSPYVCNGCPNKNRCPLVKKVYKAKEADEMALNKRKDSRTGMCFTEDELEEIDQLLSPRLKKGQSLHHIFSSDPDLFSISERTGYNLVKANKISARPIDCPRMVRMSPRRKKSKEVKIDKQCRLGRTYEDYLEYIKNNPDTITVEGDSVIGRKGGACILTLTWPCYFQLGFYREHNNSSSVTEIFNNLYNTLGYENFHKVFPGVLLVDNGTEFSNPTEIEKFGIKVFYCNPSSPYQKPICENTHEMIRRICPKGTSFDNLSQDSFDLAFSHTNSLIRKKLNNHSPYDMFNLIYGNDINIYEVFHIKKIEAEEVNLTPSLLKKAKK